MQVQAAAALEPAWGQVQVPEREAAEDSAPAAEEEVVAAAAVAVAT